MPVAKRAQRASHREEAACVAARPRAACNLNEFARPLPGGLGKVEERG